MLLIGSMKTERVADLSLLCAGGSLSLDGMATATAAPHAKGRQADEGTYSNNAVQCRF